MNLESIQTFCLQLPQTTEGIKWGNDLCFMLSEKMYCVAGLTGPVSCSFKCSDEDYVKLTEMPGIIPAPYMARNKWVNIQDPLVLTKEEWEQYIKDSYRLILSKLPKKFQQNLQ